MNGAKLPNWVKLIAVGFAVASIWYTNQNVIHELQGGQARIEKRLDAIERQLVRSNQGGMR